MLDWQQLVPGSKAPTKAADAKPSRKAAGATYGIKAPSAPRTSHATYGVRAEIIAELCQVDIATARRWKAGISRTPHAAAALLSGDPGAFSPHWQGWRIQGDAIISPDGWEIRRDDAISVPLMHAQISVLRAELDKYKTFENTEEQPAPPDALPQIIA